MTTQKKVYPPLALLNHVDNFFPRAWAQMDDFHRHNGLESLPSWPSYCYAPMGAALAITRTDFGEALPPYVNIDDYATPYAQMIAALAPWRINKDVYILDANMIDTSYVRSLDAEDEDIPVDTLLHLPHQCFYVDMSALDCDMHGFWAHLEYDTDNGDIELRVLYLNRSNGTIGYPIHLDPHTTIRAAIAKTARQGADYYNKQGMDDIARRAVITTSDIIDDMAVTLSLSIQMILLICSDNANITTSQQYPQNMGYQDGDSPLILHMPIQRQEEKK